MTTAGRPEPVAPSPAPVYRRSEVALAHAVYGLILTLATLGELINYEVTAGVSVAWLLGAGAVLLLAHLFSDLLAHVAATEDDPDWSEIVSIGREDVAVTGGAVGAAVVMAVVWLADLDAERALVGCVGLGLLAVGTLSYLALPQHGRPLRLVMGAAAVLLGVVIVTLENLF